MWVPLLRAPAVSRAPTQGCPFAASRARPHRGAPTIIPMPSNPLSWELQHSEPGPDLKLFQARFDHLTNPRNGITERMIILNSPDAANVVAITPNQELILARQYRVGIGFETLELPGGIVDPGEEHHFSAQRELREETGYASENWTFLGSIPSNPVFMDSYIHHWLATDCEPNHAIDLDTGEAVDLELMPLEEAFQRWKSGFFQHPHTVNGLLLYFRDRF
jgi:ADP-ribose pyrophosphatase